MKKYTIIEIGQKFLLASGVLLPILFEYTTPISGFTVGDFLLVMSMFFLLITKRKLSFELPFAIMFIYVILNAAFIVRPMGGYSGLFRTLRYTVYLIYPILLSNCKKYQKWIIKIYKKLSVFSAIFLIVQYVLLRLGNIFLPGVLTFLPLTDDSLYNYQYAVLYTNSGRCMSVFGEPSHYSIYVLPCVLLFLYAYDLDKRKKSLYGAFFVSASVILCASFAGLIGLMFVWGMWIYRNMKKGKVSQRIFAIVFMLAVVCICFLAFTGAGAYLTNAKVYSRQSSGRFEGFTYIKELYGINGLKEKLFGYGMNDIGELVYLSGWPRMLLYFGIAGIVAFVASFISIIRKNEINSEIIYLLMMLMIGSELNFGPFVVPYLIFIVLLKEEKRAGRIRPYLRK